MGIGYEDAVIIYNRYVKGISEEEFFVGKKFNGVRVELTQGANQIKSGMESANKCIVKIPFSEDTSNYIAPKPWQDLEEDKKGNYFTFDVDENNFFVIVQKKDLGVNADLPSGLVKSEDYERGFFNYVKNKYGYVFVLKNVDVYSLIPRFEIGGQ